MRKPDIERIRVNVFDTPTLPNVYVSIEGQPRQGGWVSSEAVNLTDEEITVLIKRLMHAQVELRTNQARDNK